MKWQRCKLFIYLIYPLRNSLLHAQAVSSQNLPEDDADEEKAEEMFAQECRDIRAAMPPQLVPLQVPDNVSKPFGQGTLRIDSLDLGALVKMRFQHQTRHAAHAIRTQGSRSATEIEETQCQKDESIRRQLIKQFHAVIKEQQAQGVGTGAEHVARWRPGNTNNEGGNSDATLVAGNAGNAAVVATQTAKKVRQTLQYSLQLLIIFFCRL